MDDLINRAQRLVCAYDAFMSYNSKDSEVVEVISRKLEDCEGLSIWKDSWALVAFVGPHGLGPWHKEEIKIALKRAIEQKTVRVIPVALPDAPRNIDLPDFLKSRHIVDLRTIDRWSLYLLRCAIVGAKPGRQDKFAENLTGDIDRPSKRSRLHVVEWSISSMRISYEIKCRVANVYGNESIIIKTVFVRTHQAASHPIKTSLDCFLAPIGQTRLKSALPVPNTRKGIMHTLEQEKYLVPGEVEDIVIPIDAPMGLRAVVSFGVHWLISDEPLYRLAETGFLAIGQRGTPG